MSQLISIKQDIFVIPRHPFSPNANTYIFGTNDEYWLLDCGLYSSYQDTKHLLVSNGFSLSNLKGIVLTHCHADHAGASAVYQTELAIPIFASDFCADVLNNSRQDITLSTLLNDTLPPSHVTPISSSITLSSRKLTIIPTPGHTAGSLCLYDPKDHILISGDTVFPDGGIGRTDFPTGDFSSLLRSIRLLSEKSVTMLLSGHGRIIYENGDDHILQALTLYG